MNCKPITLALTLGTFLLVPAMASAQQQRGFGTGTGNVGRGSFGVGVGNQRFVNPGINQGFVNQGVNRGFVNQGVNQGFVNPGIAQPPYLNASARNAARVRNTKVPETTLQLGAVAPVFFGGFPGYGYGYPAPIYGGYPVYGPVYPLPPVYPTARTVNSMGPLMDAIEQTATRRRGF
ncbi:hypothetical protein BH23PLA1_BH23PLA1_23410 [soil metagenome]